MMNKLKKHDDQQTMTIAPHVNIFEKEKEIVLELEMPGVDKQSMEVSLDNNKLFIKGNRNKEDLDKSYTALHRERSSFDYERAFELNMDVDHEN
jgi:HSP20 family protein